MVEVLQQAQVRKLLQDVIGGCDNQTATVLEVTFAQLYTANEGKHKFHGTNASGILAFLIDRREGKSYYLRLYDAANLQVLFSIELCYQFKDYWTQVAGIPNFYCIPIFNGYCGFLFPNPDEATKITTKINSMAPKKEDYERILKENKEIEDARKKAEKAEKEKHTVTGKLKSFFGGDKKDDGPQVIGDPKNFQHKMIFNLETGEIDVEKLPPQLVEVFKKAGITKKDLQDKKQAVEIFKAVAQFNENPSQLPPVAPPPQQQQQQQQPQANKGAPPPPPPPPKAPAPPPPPPPKGLPPPPPPKAAGGPSSGQAPQASAPQAPKPSSGGRADLLAEIQKGVQLKPVNKTDVEVKVNDMNNQQKDDLSSYLGQMIAIRRTELTKGKKDDSESDNGGWSDDD